MLVKKEDDFEITEKSKFIKGTYDWERRDYFLEVDEDLDVGTYYVLADLDWEEETPNKQFGIHCYGPESLEFTDVTQYTELYEFLLPAFVSHEAQDIGGSKMYRFTFSHDV